MCGIGGFSLSKGSKINPRVLSNALLSALEDRGYMASGFAWHGPDSSGHFKDAKPGSGLAVKSMPKNAHTAIVHTRLATHGSTTDNRNNHPVLSPSKELALVHNGVIYNHNYVRSILQNRIKFEVDTAVIPALIEESGHDLGSLRELDGDAAIAWLRNDEQGVLNVARLEHSPLTICQVADGSFIFASTESLLWKVLIQLDLMPDFMQNVSEYTYMKVIDGVVVEQASMERSLHVGSAYDYGYYRHQTSGAKGSKKSMVWADDYWDMPYGADYDDSYQYLLDKAERDDERNNKKYDFLGTPCNSDPAYWISYMPAYFETGSSPQYAYYPYHRVEDYEDDLEVIQDKHSDYILVDYGIVLANGTLFSDKSKAQLGTHIDSVVDPTLF